MRKSTTPECAVINLDNPISVLHTQNSRQSEARKRPTSGGQSIPNVAAEIFLNATLVVVPCHFKFAYQLQPETDQLIHYLGTLTGAEFKVHLLGEKASF